MPEPSAIDEVAEAIDHVGTAVEELILELRSARDKTHDELTDIRKLTLLVLFGLSVLMVMAIVSAYTLYLANDTISPGGGRYKQNQARTTQLIGNLAIEEDCRSRRARAGLPAPDPRGPCVGQTATEVYPGVAP